MARGDGPGDNQPENVRRIPKPGIELPAAERESITSALTEFDAAIAPLASSTPNQCPRLLDGGREHLASRGPPAHLAGADRYVVTNSSFTADFFGERWEVRPPRKE